MSVLVPVRMEVASRIAFVPKEDGILSICVDYRKINAQTIQDSYHIPHMDKCIDSFGNETIFSK